MPGSPTRRNILNALNFVSKLILAPIRTLTFCADRKDFLQSVDGPVNLRFFDHEWWRKADRVAMRVFR